MLDRDGGGWDCESVSGSPRENASVLRVVPAGKVDDEVGWGVGEDADVTT